VPIESITAEKENPNSQERVPNENVPLVWAQSLFILGNLIYDKHLSVADIDPIGRRYSATANDKTVVQIVLLSETRELQNKLHMYGLGSITFYARNSNVGRIGTVCNIDSNRSA
jgi:phosphorylase kinase alpha/beta subunit